jgi:hypothetical protein
MYLELNSELLFIYRRLGYLKKTTKCYAKVDSIPVETRNAFALSDTSMEQALSVQAQKAPSTSEHEVLRF